MGNDTATTLDELARSTHAEGGSLVEAIGQRLDVSLDELARRCHDDGEDFAEALEQRLG